MISKIRNWQLHTIEIDDKNKELFQTHFPNVIYPPILFTGTVVEDIKNRWNPGDHMRSTYVVLLDRQNGIIETMNSTYEMDMTTENQDIFGNLNNKVLSLFY